MAEGDVGSADRAKKGQGIVRGFKTIGSNLKGENTHPEITGDDPMRKGPGRPTKGESSFTTVGPEAEQEQGPAKKTE